MTPDPLPLPFPLPLPEPGTVPTLVLPLRIAISPFLSDVPVFRAPPALFATRVGVDREGGGPNTLDAMLANRPCFGAGISGFGGGTTTGLGFGGSPRGSFTKTTFIRRCGTGDMIEAFSRVFELRPIRPMATKWTATDMMIALVRTLSRFNS